MNGKRAGQSKRGDALRVADIATELTGLDTILQLGRPRFDSDDLVQDAAIRRLEIVGEAAGHVSQETRRRYPDIPWRKMRGFRTLASHEYWRVELNRVWDAVLAASKLRSEFAVVRVVDVRSE